MSKTHFVLRLESSGVQPAMISSSCKKEQQLLHLQQVVITATIAGLSTFFDDVFFPYKLSTITSSETDWSSTPGG